MKFTIYLVLLFFSTTLMAQIPENAEDISPLLIGETVPNSVLFTVDGKETELNTIIKNKPTVLVFYRGGWCPYCNRHLSALGESEQEIIDMGYQIIAISPDHFEMLKPTIENEKLSYQVYSDNDANLIKKLGIAFKTPERAKGYIFKKTEKEASEVLPVPTVMILDTKGKIHFEYINPDYSTRLSSNLLLANLKALNI